MEYILYFFTNDNLIHREGLYLLLEQDKMTTFHWRKTQME
jgi:hypothetical protein